MTDTPLPKGESLQQMAYLVRDIARALADDQESIRVVTQQNDDETILRLIVSDADLGKLIGKQGRTARSIRAIVGAAANKLKIRCSVDIQAQE